ncbi:hypothetical protein [Pseudomonas cedrina]|uniref:hypothetical protein n=1 Tax=Pseudomonas cedrina TaxID=651740 RepID=UPI002787D37E|nr:hypothetical protein [Pseudomonas cedrina]MDQ0655196.1 hypothetical protein [Pseudomonas cedrina]
MEMDKVENTVLNKEVDAIERGVPGEQFRYEVFTTVMSSIPSQRDRFAGLTEEQRFAEFRAGEESPAKLAELRVAHDAIQLTPVEVSLPEVLPVDAPEFRIWHLPDRIAFDARLDAAEIEFEEARDYIAEAEQMTIMSDVSVAPPAGRDAYERLARARDEVAVALAEVQRFEAFTTVMGTQSERDRLAGLTEDQRVAEFVASEQSPALLAEIRKEHDSQQPQVLPDNLEELLRADTPELRVDTTSVLPDNLEELLRADTPELRVDTTTVLPDNLEELLRADTPEVRVETATVLPDNLEELLRADTPEPSVHTPTVMPGNNLDELLRTERLANARELGERQALQGIPAKWDPTIYDEWDQNHFDWFVNYQMEVQPERTLLLTDEEIYYEYLATQFENRGEEVMYQNDLAIQSRNMGVILPFPNYALDLIKEGRGSKLASNQLAIDPLTGALIPPDTPSETQTDLHNKSELQTTQNLRFEAWQGVIGSIESESTRMAILTLDQQRLEYEASQISPERFQQVRAVHDSAYGYGVVKPIPPEKGSLAHWAVELTEAANKNRRPLSGSEFKQIVSSIESCSRGADLEKAKAREVAVLLAKVHGPSGEDLFRDPELRSAYKAAFTPDQNVTQTRLPSTQEPKAQVAEKNNRTVIPIRMR